MKVSTVLCLLVGMLGANAETYSQQVNLSVKDASLKQIFTTIRQQTGYNFLYNESWLQHTKKVTISATNAPLTEVLDQCFKDQPVSYTIIQKTISLHPKIVAAPTIIIPETVPPPPIIITGRVTNAKGEPIPMVSIVIKGTNKGFVTDFNGYFKFQVDAGVKILVFSHVGMIKQEVVIANRTTINVVLVEEIANLQEVQVISTGYQKIKPEQSTGSISTIRLKDYDSRINTTDFLTGLQNKIPGLLINNDITFEGNSLFQIRGISTINGSKQPLIVIDGYPTELTLDAINPNEIESVTVLKDAAAATIYGVRASNGVLVIERKKAQMGKANVVFRTTFGFKPKENYDRYRWAKNASEISVEYAKNNGGGYAAWWPLMNMLSVGGNFNYTPPVLTAIKLAAGVIDQKEADQQWAAMSGYNNAKDYSNTFLRTAITKTYDLDISGGTDKALYYITANYLANDLTQIKNDNNNFRFSTRTNFNLSKRFSLELTADFQQKNTTTVPVPSISDFYPYEHFEDENGNPLSTYTKSNASPFFNQMMMNAGLLDNLYYPLTEINLVSDKSKTINNRITANLRYKIGNGFDISFGGEYESSTTNNKHLANEQSAEVRQYVNYYTSLSTTGALVFNIPKGDYLKENNSSTENYSLRAQLNYNKVVNHDHSFNIILGGEIRDAVSKTSSAAYFGYSDQTLLQLPVDYNVITNNFAVLYARSNSALSYTNLFNQGYTDNRYVSAYSNIVYAYKGKYTLTGSARIDQSNLFGTNQKYRYKPLWSVGAGWNINKENFIQDIDWIKSLKLRASYGFNGNVAKNVLPEVIAVATTSQFDNTLKALTLSSPANSRVRWEKTSNFNVGLDYSIFKNITGNIDYYTKTGTDILANNVIDPTKGLNSAITNESSIRNNGLEVSLHADWMTRKDFNWNTGLIFSYNTSKLLKYYNSDIQNTGGSYLYALGGRSTYLEGYAVGAVFSYRYAGVDSTGRALIYDKDGKTKNFDQNDKGRSDVVYRGSSIPTVNIGLSNRVDVGSFYVYAMINFYGGFVTKMPLLDPSVMRPYAGADHYWKQKGDELDPTILPSVKYSSYNSYLQASDRYVVNGAYFTLGDLTMAYSFRDSKLVKKAKISNVEIKAQASNIYTVALNKYNYSVATGSYAKPNLTPTFTVSLNVNF